MLVLNPCAKSVTRPNWSIRTIRPPSEPMGAVIVGVAPDRCGERGDAADARTLGPGTRTGGNAWRYSSVPVRWGGQGDRDRQAGGEVGDEHAARRRPGR